eukprot:scaffold23644_cov53-Attheya_sp.AAC.4
MSGTSPMQENREHQEALIICVEGEDDGILTEKENTCNRKRITKVTLGLALLGFVVFIIVDSATTGYTTDGIRDFLQWIEDNPIPGVFAFTAVYFLATGSLLTLGSGFVFANAFGLGPGILLATTSVFFGASSGATVAFLLGRYLLRDWVSNFSKKYPIFLAIDSALEVKGLRIMFLLRLSPIIPFNALDYIAGITAVSFKAYTWSLFGILPGTIFFVFLGSSAGSLTDIASSGDSSVVTIVVIVVGIVFGVLAIAATSYYAKKELNKV